MSTKKLLSNTIIYIALGFLAPAINFILLPIYTKYLDADDYALIAQSTVVQTIFANIIGLGVNAAFARYYFDYYEDSEALNKLYSTSIISYFLTGLVTMLILSLIGPFLFDITFKNNVFTFWSYGMFSIIIAWISNIQTLTLNFYRNKEDAVKYAFFAIFFFISVAFSIYVGVVLLDLKAYGSIVGRLIGVCVPIFIYLVYYFSKNKIEYSNLLNKKMILFGLPMVPYLFLNAILSQADKFAVERYFDLKILGLYSFGFLIASVNDIFINSLGAAINPQLLKTMKNEDPKENSKLSKLFKGYLAAGIIVNVLITVCGTICIHLFINEKYVSVAYFFPLLSLAYLFRVIYTAYTVPIIYKKQTNILPFINVITFVLTVVFLLGFISIWGLIGVCIARILIQFAQTITTWIILKRKGFYHPEYLNFHFEYGLILFIILYISVWYFIVSKDPSTIEYLGLLPLLILAFGILGLKIKSIFRV